ncbi:MAG TPA: ribonuclease HII [Bryobacterales bacterium]|nr:ribonuclease HII [Bryobacterales bacterium]
MRCTRQFEGRAWRQGYRLVAGVDEVGRGALFGPVVAAAVILDPQQTIRGLNDSKQLDPARREKLAALIRERALAVALGAVDAARIDQMNIYQATLLAMRQAITALHPKPDFLLLDAVRLDLPLPQQSLIKGDCRSASIAAASIIAKVERDAWMRQWDAVFPQYHLAGHKGYGTPDHLDALEHHGPSPLHRRSFSLVAAASRFPSDRPAENLELFPSEVLVHD